MAHQLRIVSYDTITPRSANQIIDMAEAQARPLESPPGVADDFGPEGIADVAQRVEAGMVLMVSQIKLGDIVVKVARKDIKNVHLRVFPPAGSVRISAPRRMSLPTIRAFAISKLDWIKRHQAKLREQVRETPRRYVDQESHSVWGKRYLLTVSERNHPPLIELRDRRMHLRVRPGTDERKRRALVEHWYRQQIKKEVVPLFDKWQPLMGVKVERLFVRRMKTKWGSCNYKAHTIRLNTELAKRPPEYLEYVVVHELVHLLEPTHNANFAALMDWFLPGWQVRREELNRQPLW